MHMIVHFISSNDPFFLKVPATVSHDVSNTQANHTVHSYLLVISVLGMVWWWSIESQWHSNSSMAEVLNDGRQVDEK